MFNLNYSTFLLPVTVVGTIMVVLFLLLLLLLFYKENKARKKIAKELFLKNEWFRKIMNRLSDGIIATNSKGVITMINTSASVITGWEKQKALGCHINTVFKITDQQTKAQLVNPVLDAIEKNKNIPLVNHALLQQKDGNCVCIDNSGVPLHNNKGEVVGGVLLFRDLTAKKRAEDPLRSINLLLESKVGARTPEEVESDIFSTAVLGSISSHIAVINSDGRIIAVNKSWENHAKKNGETNLEHGSIGSNYFDVCEKSILLGDLFTERALKGIKSVFNKEEDKFEIEYPCHTHNQQQWFNLSASQFGDDDLQVVLVHKDITDRELAKQATKISESNYRRLFESAKDGILILDANTGMIEDVNPYLIHKLGFPYDYFIGKELWEIGLFHDAKASKIAFEELQRKEYIRYEDLPLKTKEGEHLKVEFISNIYLADHKKVIQCNIRDITERVAAERNLKESERRLKEAQAISHTANWEINLVTNENNWSDEFFQIFGLERGDIEPSRASFLNLINPAHRVQAHKSMQEAFDEFKDSSFDFSFTAKDGSLKNACSEWQFEYDKNNVPVRLYGIIQDTTERKAVEEKLERQNKELKKANAELDRFVYSTSHDLRAPLTSLMGLIDIIDEDLVETEIDQKERIKMMKQSIAKLDNFIEDIINYSRNSRTGIEENEINFKEIINQSYQSLKYMEGSARIAIEVVVEQTGKFISDKRRIQLTLNNLISNAIKYQDKAKENPYIIITVVTDTEKAIITVEDNGIGIAEEKQAKVFEMFYRATLLSIGSGLGLYIASEAVSKLAGTIYLKSNQGVKTTFTITIPNLLEINQTR